MRHNFMMLQRSCNVQANWCLLCWSRTLGLVEEGCRFIYGASLLLAQLGLSVSIYQMTL